MTEQDKLLEIQMNLSPRTRAIDILTIAVTLLIIFGFAIGIYIYPDREFSEQENIYLQQYPKFTMKRLVNGKFTEEFAEYYSDQFPFRDMFVGIKGVTEIAQLKMQNNNVTLSKDGYIIKREDYPSFGTVDKNLEAVNNFGEAMNELGIPFTIAMAGRSADVLQRYLPSMYPNDLSDRLWTHFEETLSANQYVDYADLRTPLKALIDSDDGKQYYYKTDHHWTTLGAYIGYCEIMKSFGVEPQPIENFTVETVSDSFYGTTWSSAGMKWVRPDSMQYFRYDGDTDFTTDIIDTGTKFKGFYDLSYLDKKDKYSSFISGNNARVDIYPSESKGEREKLLLIKDSFAHSLAPFLAYHYDLVILDLRYYKMSVKQLVADEGIDRVLIMHNIGTLTETNILGILNLELKK